MSAELLAQHSQELFAQVIRRTFQVTYYPDSVGRLLHQPGWSVQKPKARAIERDEELIAAWLRRDWPRLKESAAARRRHCV